MVEPDVKARASRILRQLAAVEVERAELARELGAGGAGAFEDELARLWRALADHVEQGFDIVKAASISDRRDPWTEKPSALTFWGNLSAAQEDGNACLICGGSTRERYPDQRSAVINGKQMFIHCDPEVCTRELKQKLEKEIPF